MENVIRSVIRSVIRTGSNTGSNTGSIDKHESSNANCIQYDTTEMQTDASGIDYNRQDVPQSNFKDFMLALITEYNRILPMCRKMDYQLLGQEPRWVKEIWKIFPESQGLTFWTDIFEEVKKSSWLTSKASFPFLITLDRVKELLAGKYQEASPKSKSQQRFENNIESLQSWVPPEERSKNAIIA